MVKLFDYHTLHITIEKATRSLTVYLRRPHLDQDTLDELEHMINWFSEHIEVESFVLTSIHDFFGKGLNPKEIKEKNTNELKKFFYSLQKIILGLLYLPQTCICDFKKGARGTHFELSLGADLRVAHKDAQFCLDHLQTGLGPSCGGIGLLSALTSPSWAKNWILSGLNFDAKQLYQSGLIINTYENNVILTKKILTHINAQSAVQKIQAKRAFLQGIRPKLEESFHQDLQFSLAGLITEDWKESALAIVEGRTPKFKSAKDVANILKSETIGQYN